MSNTAGNGVELTDDESGVENCVWSPVDGVSVFGETRLLIGWLRDIGLTDAALAVADAHHLKMAEDSGQAEIAREWLKRTDA